MKAKMLHVNMIVMFLIATGFLMNKPEPGSIVVNPPQGFYVKVAMNNVPVTEAIVLVYIGDQLWDEDTINPYPSGWDYTKWHEGNYTGTVSVTVKYYYNACWYLASDYVTGYFYWLNQPAFTFNSYSVGDCD
jgi:hypothetical protein